MEFEKSYKLNPFPVVLFNIGICYKSLNEYVNAVKFLNMYLDKLGNKASKKEKEKIKSLIENMMKNVGSLEVHVNVKEATVKVDGDLKGHGPIVECDLDAGTYELVVEKTGFRTWKSEIIIEAQEITIIEATLEPIEEKKPKEEKVTLAAGKKGKAHISVNASQEDAVVAVDGEIWGKVPQSKSIESGFHRIVVRAKEYDTWTKELGIKENENITFEINLTKKKEKPKWKSSRWWLWTAIGVVVGGSIAAAIAVPATRAKEPLKGSLETKFPE
jgi:hypothetical protein